MNPPTTIPTPENRPYYMTEEMYLRLWAMFDSGASLLAIGDTLNLEYPEIGGRNAGNAAIWMRRHLAETRV
jgi:hypothetical protein